jgi:hypothetical protein
MQIVSICKIFLPPPLVNSQKPPLSSDDTSNENELNDEKKMLPSSYNKILQWK